jgi:hypothetical protein
MIMATVMKTLCSTSATIETNRGALNTQSCSAKDRNFLDRIKEMLGGFAVCGKRTAQRAQKMLDTSLVTLSTVTTPNGPWVYTIVPWED